MPNTPALPDRIARIARIADKVRKRFRLNPPLTEAQLRDFENRHGISLPEGYRAFLLLIGTGGPGPPHYGLALPGEAANDMSDGEARLFTQLPHVRKPFPFTKPWVWETGETSDEGTSEQIDHGCLYLGNDGCGMYWYLIVTGPQRGNVWMTCGEGTGPTDPPRDFLQWYEDWLDGVRDWWT